MYSIKSVISSLLLFVVMASCTQKVNVEPTGKTYRVDLIHTYDSLTESYARFDNTLRDEFQKAGLNVELNVHFMDVYTGEPNSPQAQQVLKQLKKNKPDLLLLEDDLGVYSIMGTNDSLLYHTPIVLGNMHLPLEGDTMSVKSFIKDKDAAVWIAPTDYPKNLKMAYDIKKNNLIEIELDYSYGEMALRKQLSQSIATDEFLDDTDFHDMNLGWNDINVRLKDKIIVTAFSIKNPELNVGPADSLWLASGLTGQSRTKGMMDYAMFYTSLVIKKDLYSNAIALATDQPQFTCVNVDFANSNASYIGGYFPLVETVATDMASSAIQILQGEKASKLPVNYHKQDYYVDWNAVLEMKPDNPNDLYNELSAKYNILNVPYSTAHPKLYWFYIISAILAAILLVIITMWLWNKRRAQKLRELRQRLDLDRQYGNLVLLGVSSCTFHYDRKNGLQLGVNEFNQLAIPEGLDAFNKIALQVKPEYLGTIEEIRKTITRKGDYNFLLPITLDKGFSYNWIQLRYKVTEKDGNLNANGLIIDANENVVRESLLNEAKRKQKETEQKEKFLGDLKNVISQPMDKILKYSETLAEDTQAHTQEEYMSIVKKLDAEGQTLMDIVNKILELVRMESGRVQLELKPHSVNAVLTEMEQRWIQKLPENLTLDIQIPKAALMVVADRMRLDQLLDIFMERIINNKKEGKIRVDVDVDQVQNELEIVFKNNNEDISHELSKLIQKTFQEQRNFDPKIGLGLNIANAIATNMNGRLTFQSYPSIGTRLGVILKLSQL